MAYISEISYDGNTSTDFVEVAVPEGTDVSGWSVVVYNNGGNSQRSIPFDAPAATANGQDIYLFLGTGSLGGINKNSGIALVDDNGDTVQFLSFEGNTIDARKGAASGQTSENIGTAESGESLQSTDGGASYTSRPPTPGTIPCFAPGTRIRTPEGWKFVENLRVGDLICTLDQGPQPVAWICSNSEPISPDEQRWPILIKSGAFGPGLPENDLIVSGQHRVLAGQNAPLADLLDKQYLLPAKSLTSLPRIREMRGKRQVTWYHFACARHAICFAEGLAVESLYLGPMVLSGLPKSVHHYLSGLLGPLDSEGALNGPRARQFLTVTNTRRVLASGAKKVA